MQEETFRRHPIFIKYTRKWLNQVTGYSFGLLSRVATGKRQASQPFMDRCCYHLNELEAELFLPQCIQGKCSSGGCGEKQITIGQWLSDICQRERLSLRDAAAKTGLSHVTISDIIKGGHALPETIRKLARAFAKGGANEYLALEDYLLVQAGYRTGRLKGEEPTQTMARLLDKLNELNEREVEMMTQFAQFLIQLREDLYSS